MKLIFKIFTFLFFANFVSAFPIGAGTTPIDDSYYLLVGIGFLVALYFIVKNVLRKQKTVS